jgi:hypothetical protein
VVERAQREHLQKSIQEEASRQEEPAKSVEVVKEVEVVNEDNLGADPLLFSTFDNAQVNISNKGEVFEYKI